MTEEPIKICPQCGWKYSWKSPRRYCRICHVPMKGVRCNVCGVYVPLKDRPNKDYTLCKTCFTAHKKQYADAMYERFDMRYDGWLERIAKIPTPYKTLTEDEWLAACRYFCGCALCNEDLIAARCFFIPFEEGGRYCDWNVIPMCQDCATRTKTQPNLWRSIGPNNAARMKRIVAYLEPILERRVNEAGTTDGV